jgi:uncharacterized protein (TIGR00369 family)
MSKQQNSSSMCFVCGRDNPIGLKVIFREEDNRVIGEFTPRPEHQSYPGTMHGGLSISLLDEVMGRTAFLENLWVVTARMQIAFRKPVPVGETITVVGEIRKLKGRVLEAHGEIILADGSLAVEADSTCIKIPDSKIAGMLEETRLYSPEEVNET